MGSEISTISKEELETGKIKVTHFQHLEEEDKELEFLIEPPVKKNKIKRSKSLESFKNSLHKTEQAICSFGEAKKTFNSFYISDLYFQNS